MSEVLSSQFRITHLGVVRVDFGDATYSEIKMPWQAEGTAVARPRAPFQQQVSFGNAVNSISFDRVLVSDTAAAARNALLAHNAALSGDVGDAVIESLDGGTFTLRGARLTAVNPRIEDGCRVVCDYTLTGGKLDDGTDSTGELGDTAPLTTAEDGDTAAL